MALQPNTEAVNENMRDRLQRIQAGAQSLSQHAGLAAAVKARIVARSLAGADAVQLKQFDPGAVAAITDLAEQMSSTVLSDLQAHADTASTAAQSGLRGLEQYLEHEDLVASVGIDPTTLDRGDA